MIDWRRRDVEALITYCQFRVFVSTVQNFTYLLKTSAFNVYFDQEIIWKNFW